MVESVYSAVGAGYLHNVDLEAWWKVFTALCGQIDYVIVVYDCAELH
jgi:hypothetical protein